MTEFPQLSKHVANHPYPLIFATVSGAHLYGFPSDDSDFDMRGIHVLPLNDVVGLGTPRETVEKEGIYDGLEIDLVTHDVRKFFGLLLKKNGYVLEQVLSPLIVHTTPDHEELRAIAGHCVTRHHAHHYLGFAANQWKLFHKESPQRVKPLLYVYRVLLTGIHLMKSGQIESNLQTLNETTRLSWIDELIQQKREGPEKGSLAASNLSFHEQQYERLVGELEQAYEQSTLPETTDAKPALNDLLVRIRLST